MPERIAVGRLSDIAQESVLMRVCSIILEEIFIRARDEYEVLDYFLMTERLQFVRDILACSIGPKLMEDLLSVILRKDLEIEANVRYLALQMLLIKGIKTLVVGHFPEYYYSVILEAIAESAADLRRLDLRGIWVRECDKFYLHKLLRRISNVEHLVLRYVCDDDTLDVIGKHCANLQRLDLSGSPHITPNGVALLTNHPSRCRATCNLSHNLSIVDIGGPGALKLQLQVAIDLLLALPNLKSFGCYDRVGSALIQSFETYPDKCFQLQYLHDINTKSAAVLAITKTCSALRAVYLDTPGSVAVQHLDMFKNLREIKLNKIQSTDLMILLDKCHDRIRSLALLSVWGNVDIVRLGAVCPSLVRLELHNVALVCSAISHPTAFHHLTQIFIYSTQITTMCVKMILNQAHNVEHLALGECRELTDAAVLCSLMDHSLLKVHTLWFGLAEKLSMRTVQGFIEKCAKLRSLGNLAAWSVSATEVDQLRIQLQISNYHLAIHYIAPQEQQHTEFIQLFED